MPDAPLILQVAVNVPLYTQFDYLPPALVSAALQPGQRVVVPFGRRSTIGIITAVKTGTDLPPGRLKPATGVIDERPLLDTGILQLLYWASRYYQHPVGEVIVGTLPALLRQGLAPSTEGETLWLAAGDPAGTRLERAPRQHGLFVLLHAHPDGLDDERLNALTDNWRGAMKGLVAKGLVEQRRMPCLPAAAQATEPVPVLTAEQRAIVEDIRGSLNAFGAHLVHGVTGSGKTETYMALARDVIDSGRQVMVLVPEISLTPQLTARFRDRLGVPTAVLHSGLNDRQRLCAWASAAGNEAPLLIGTRSAVFTPMPKLGLIIVDEEHDGSFKQQDGFRYNARDLALVRAQQVGIPVVLGSATPALESLHNAWQQRYRLHRLTQRARAQPMPAMKLVDLRSQKLVEGLAPALLDAVDAHVANHGQVMLFLNRRGFSPLLMCHHCGWTTACRRCDAHMTYHQKHNRLRCHHCGAEAPIPRACGDCGSGELIAIGSGTERIEQALRERFTDLQIERIDRDTTRRKGALDSKLEEAHSGRARILIGTQMLAKGHDFPKVSLVGILDTDQGLYSSDFRAAEHLAQLITQVAGRAGRGERPGEVLIQTHHPDHPLLQQLLHSGYEGFARAALQEREAAGLPPWRHMAVLRSEAVKKTDAESYMREAAELLRQTDPALDIFGPLPAPMERRAGRYRTQLILQSRDRKSLQAAMSDWVRTIQDLKSATRVRWSLDIDPYDTY